MRFAVHYLLCGRVGGDFYDVFRLDEHHVGFYVADAMGHGVPASLLTIFVKKGVRAKEIFGLAVPPGAARRGALPAQPRPDRAGSCPSTPFITMVYGLFNSATGTLPRRAGHPYPIHARAERSLVGPWFPAVAPAATPAGWGVSSPHPPPPRGGSPRRTGRPATPTGLLQPPRKAMLDVRRGRLLPRLQHREMPLAEYVSRLASDCEGPDGFKDDVTVLEMEVDPTDRP